MRDPGGDLRDAALELVERAEDILRAFDPDSGEDAGDFLGPAYELLVSALDVLDELIFGEVLERLREEDPDAGVPDLEAGREAFLEFAGYLREVLGHARRDGDRGPKNGASG